MIARARSAHWDEVFTTRDLDRVSWHRADLEPSLTLLGPPQPGSSHGSVVDVGTGASFLPDALLAQGWDDVTVLDVSAESLVETRKRLGDRVDYVISDVLEWRPRQRFDAWHDRAVFHFLTEPDEQAAYADLAAQSLRPGGRLVMATFGPDGPSSCSGLLTARHDESSLAAIFTSFEVLEASEQVHTTPSGVAQQFTWVALRRSDDTGVR